MFARGVLTHTHAMKLTKKYRTMYAGSVNSLPLLVSIVGAGVRAIGKEPGRAEVGRWEQGWGKTLDNSDTVQGNLRPPKSQRPVVNHDDLAARRSANWTVCGGFSDISFPLQRRQTPTSLHPRDSTHHNANADILILMIGLPLLPLCLSPQQMLPQPRRIPGCGHPHRSTSA